MPREFIAPLIGVLGLGMLFLIVLATGSTYAGIRHAFPAVPPIALLAAFAIYYAITSKSFLMRGAVIVSLIAALLSAIPILRPWEYYNEAVGGAANGYRYFDDEGVDLVMRTKELAKYYNENLRASNEIPTVIYYMRWADKESQGLDWTGKDPERDRDKLNNEIVSGTFILSAKQLAPKLWWDRSVFRNAVPAARFGNLFIFHGTFNAPAIKAHNLYYRAIDDIYTAEPDTEEAIKLLSESVTTDPKAFFVALELGNQYLKVGKREDALRAYRIAMENAPASDEIRKLLAQQLELVASEALEHIAPLRNPEIE
jgi:tetratricopeptide (TPR) repeat protein